MREEEIIKDLEEVIELHEDQCLIMTDEDFEAIQGLLDLYNKKKRDFMKLQAFYSKDYVSKDKIREKIKELESCKEKNFANIKTLQHGHYDTLSIKDFIEIGIEFLQNLLEEE